MIEDFCLFAPQYFKHKLCGESSSLMSPSWLSQWNTGSNRRETLVELIPRSLCASVPEQHGWCVWACWSCWSEQGGHPVLDWSQRETPREGAGRRGYKYRHIQDGDPTRGQRGPEGLNVQSYKVMVKGGGLHGGGRQYITSTFWISPPKHPSNSIQSPGCGGNHRPFPIPLPPATFLGPHPFTSLYFLQVSLMCLAPSWRSLWQNLRTK